MEIVCFEWRRRGNIICVDLLWSCTRWVLWQWKSLFFQKSDLFSKYSPVKWSSNLFNKIFPGQKTKLFIQEMLGLGEYENRQNGEANKSSIELLRSMNITIGVRCSAFKFWNFLYVYQPLNANYFSISLVSSFAFQGPAESYFNTKNSYDAKENPATILQVTYVLFHINVSYYLVSNYIYIFSNSK